MNEKRQYRMRERARAQAETRQKIVEATMHLHEEIGPRATTISAIAEKAGVQRLTVYRHFEDEFAVFRACTSHWLSLNPPPDPAEWQTLAGLARFRAALADFYGYYRRTERMWTASFRDVDEVPALQAPMAEFQAFLTDIAAGLIDALARQGYAGRLAGVTVRHLLTFPVWQHLDGLGLDDAAKVDLAVRWLEGASAATRD